MITLTHYMALSAVLFLIGIFGALGQIGARLGQHAHHDLGVDEVFGTSQADEANLFRTRCLGSGSIFAVEKLYGCVFWRHVIF